MKKKMWILVSIMTLGVIALFYMLLKPDPLDREFNSIVYSSDTGFSTTTTIKIKGDLYNRLLGENQFIGELTADNDLKYKITLYENDWQYLGMIITFDKEKSIQTIGSVVLSHELDKVWIKLDDMNQRYQLKDGYISGPANNLEEAQQIAWEVLTGDEK